MVDDLSLRDALIVRLPKGQMRATIHGTKVPTVIGVLFHGLGGAFVAKRLPARGSVVRFAVLLLDDLNLATFH